jgi:hypothetical protein
MAKLRIVSIYLICLMMVSLAGCSSDSNSDDGVVDNTPPVDVDLTSGMEIPEGDGDTSEL